MTRDDVLLALGCVFRDVFDDERIIVEESTNANDIEDWDSMEHINLILATEKRFHVKFTMDEVTQMKNVGDTIDIIISRGVL